MTKQFNAEFLNMDQEVFDTLQDSVYIQETKNIAGIKSLTVKKRNLDGTYTVIFNQKYINVAPSENNIVNKGMSLNMMAGLTTGGYLYLGKVGNKFIFERPEIYIQEEDMIVEGGQQLIPADIITVEKGVSSEHFVQKPSFETRIDETIKLPDGNWVTIKDYTNTDLLQMRVIPYNYRFGSKIVNGKRLTIQQEFETFPLATQDVIDNLLKISRTFVNTTDDSIVRHIFLAAEKVGEDISCGFFVNGKTKEQKDFSLYTKPEFWESWFPTIKYSMSYHLLNGGVVPENLTDAQAIAGVGNFGQTCHTIIPNTEEGHMSIKVKPEIGVSSYNDATKTFTYDPSKSAIMWCIFHLHNTSFGYNGKEKSLEYAINLNTGESSINLEAL